MQLYLVSPDDVKTAPDELERPFDELFTSKLLRTQAGTADLQLEVEGEFRTWSIEEMAFV
jgi:hypothetical protein